MNMNPDKIRIVDNKATNRKCDHPGVVGENDSCVQQNKIIWQIKKLKLENLYLKDKIIWRAKKSKINKENVYRSINKFSPLQPSNYGLDEKTTKHNNPVLFVAHVE